MNARPVRDAATSTASAARTRVAFLDEPQQDQRRELGARRDHERPADRGHRAELEAEAYATSDGCPTAISTGTSDSNARMTERSRTARNRNTNRIAR